MKRSRIWTMLLCAASLAGCGTAQRANNCDGFERLNPSSQTRTFIIKEDRPFAQEVAAHNRMIDKCQK